MNRNYKVIWNASLNCFMAVAEYAKSRGKSSSTVVSSSTSVSENADTGGMRLLRLSALSVGLLAAGMSMPAMAGYEAGGSSASTRTDCTPGIPGTSGTVGIGAEASGAIAIGGEKSSEVACAPTDDSIAIGGSASTKGAVAGNSQSIAIGTLAKASGDQSVALGANVIASGNSSVAIGGDDIDKIADNVTKNDAYEKITGVRLIRGNVPGGSYQATKGEGAGSSAFGVQAYAKGDFSTALGMSSAAIGDASVALGVNAKSSGEGALAIGAVSNASQKGSVALGINSKSSGLNSIAIGSGSSSTTGANASGENATSIGSQSSAAANATAIGSGAKANIAGGVAIGTGSIANTAAGIKGFDPSTGGPTTKTGSVWNSTQAAVALGDGVTVTRQLTGLAAGTNASDAVNVAQLKTVTDQTFKVAASTGGVKAVKTSDTVKFVDGKNIKVIRTDNSTGTGSDITIATADVLDVTSVTAGNSLLNNDGLTITGGPSITTTGINAGNKKITNLAYGTDDNDAATVGQIKGITTASNNALGTSIATNLGGGSTYDVSTGKVTAPTYNVQGGTQNNVGDALGALDGAINDIKNVNQSISDAAVQYDKNANGTINKENITLGGGVNGTTITNVKGGDLTANSKDAINGSQLFVTNQQVSQNTTDIGNLKNEITNGGVGLVKQDIDNNITVAANKGGTSVSMAGTDGDRTVSGVKAGAVNATSSEAINGAQLNAANTTIANILGGGSKVDDKGNVTAPTYEIAGDKYNDVGSALKAADVASLTRFDSLNNRIDEAFGYTNDRIDSVERQANAGIAAALSLESAPYIPGKFTYSIGAGYHRGENAIGGSLRRTADSGRWSITGGVATDSEGGASGRIGLSGVIN